jgi:hypothetical protein
VAALLEEIAGEIGGEPGRSIQAIAAQAPASVLAAGSSLSPPAATKPRPRWRRGSRATTAPVPPPDGGSARVRAALETEVGDPVRAILAKKARAQASISELALALNDLTRRSG